ncbi:MAG: FAD-dependent monooxygenase [Crocinitomicaceae bacterium]|nr:FAD-dependent monooxygenase [Flavobacteriales bacterium]NQZ34409.1 FAD-dependent monooxygenase [Crocinitomicaceae bacterium]
MNTDVVIVGGGISGLILSILLKEKKIDHVVLNRVEKRKTLELPETIPPSTLVLLESLNLLELFSKSSSKTFGYHSLWNSDVLTTDNFFNHNPYKYGLKLNKKKLLSDLGELVSDNIIQFNNLIEIDRSDENVTVKIESDHTVQTINSRIIIDATGRNRAILKLLGITNESLDNQVALSCHLPYFKHPKLIHPVYVESFENGWGIVSTLNEHINGMTLYTKKGSSILPQLKDYQNWKELLSNTKLLKDFLTDDLNRKVVGGKANSSKASQITGSNWLAIGDAAIAFDPLSSHGISNAIYCANLASTAIESHVTNDAIAPFQQYDDTICQIFNEYSRQKLKLYDTHSHY